MKDLAKFMRILACKLALEGKRDEARRMMRDAERLDVRRAQVEQEETKGDSR